ncbi:DUF882 domain-containing protein [Shewanella psychropiezotolerans]|uniref:Murein endopeptidase K n=2 Tax=Shewanellaceae TaxID=267890 RepID=A0ABX5X1Q2_9GAMM|nr:MULTISPECIES: DUF882 domain-containing protein [Shewanella]MPY24725.1 DUF882 domain-containing protein [Shewanella sp. YLB-07]QDO83878.1 DUF882 domain-containing protein [Shewanella psychropiezotolerans]
MSVVCPTRRQLLLGLSGAAMFSMVPSKVYASRSTKGVRRLGFYNLHTGERGQGSYWVDGNYQSEILSDFSHILRDHRRNESAPMDKRLYNLLFKLKESLNIEQEFNVISGYRSPKTNAMLAAKSSGVAKKSYHMKGMAMDIALEDVKLTDLRDAAIELKLGGVGYYPRSGFIHVDTGPVRTWS